MSDPTEDTPEDACGDELPTDLGCDNQLPDEGPSHADEVAHERSLAGGAGLSFALSLVALLAILALHQTAQFLRAPSKPIAAVSITAAVVIALALLIAIPSWIAAVVFALGSLLTIQPRWLLALLALLICAVSGAVFLLVN